MSQRIDNGYISHHARENANYTDTFSHYLEKSGRISVGVASQDYPGDPFHSTSLYLTAEQAQELHDKLGAALVKANANDRYGIKL